MIPAGSLPLRSFLDHGNRQRKRYTFMLFFGDSPRRTAGGPFRKSRLRTSWQPPRSQHVERWSRLLRTELTKHGITSHRRHCRNDWLATKAKNWLPHRSDRYSVVSSDQNLGDVLICRAILAQLSRQQLSEGFVKISTEAAERARCCARDAFDHVCRRGETSGVLAKRQADFIRHGSCNKRSGICRCTVKLHNPSWQPARFAI